MPLEQTVAWFTKAVPEPTDQTLQVQLGVHFEEVAEMIETLTALDPETRHFLGWAHNALEQLAKHLKSQEPRIQLHEHDRVEFLDAVCDQLVTAAGAGYQAKQDVIGGLAEVNRSNWSKFVNGEPQFDANGKITKGPDYSKAQLAEFAI